MSINYKSHQKRVKEKLKNRRGILVYHELGSGKTLSSIHATEDIKRKVKVVVPASLIYNFRENIDKAQLSQNKFDISSYEKFNKNPTISKGDTLIIDEAHRIRNSASKTSQNLRASAKKASKVLLLTGTPIQNKPHELAPLINVLTGEATLPLSEGDFNKKYLKRTRISPGLFDRLFRGAKAYKVKDIANEKDLRKKVRGLVDYQGMDVTNSDFPSKKEHKINIGMSDSQVEAYGALYGKISARVKWMVQNNIPMDERSSKELNAFSNAVRQIANTEAGYVKKAPTSPKLKAIISKIKHSKGPVVVYSNYLSSGLNPLKKELDERKINSVTYTGKLNKKQKAAIIKQYNSGKLKALLVSTAGGEGLDLKNTRQIHIMEPHWHEAKLDQVIGRTVRYKSHQNLPKKERKVDVYKYISQLPEKKPGWLAKLFGAKPKRNASIDEYLYQLADDKKKLNNKFLEILKEEGSR